MPQSLGKVIRVWIYRLEVDALAKLLKLLLCTCTEAISNSSIGLDVSAPLLSPHRKIDSPSPEPWWEATGSNSIQVDIGCRRGACTRNMAKSY